MVHTAEQRAYDQHFLAIAGLILPVAAFLSNAKRMRSGMVLAGRSAGLTAVTDAAQTNSSHPEPGGEAETNGGRVRVHENARGPSGQGGATHCTWKPLGDELG